MNSFEDDLFGDEKFHHRMPSHQSENTAADEDDFYEKLGGSLYGGSSTTNSTAKSHNLRFQEPDRLNTFYEYPEAGDMSYSGIEYPPSAYNRYSRISTVTPDLVNPGSPPAVRNSQYRFLNVLLPGQMETNDYNVNLLEEANETDDPFGDDDSLFSDTGEEPVRKANTLRRRFGDADEDDFTPRLNYTKTIKRAKLVHGNYVIDAPVPKSLLEKYGQLLGDSNETSFVRYSGVTCGPSNFGKFNYNLRQMLYSPPRETELMVCITMYNEDEILLGRTLEGVFNNIKNLTNRREATWGDGSWKKIVVVIVNDGRLQLNERTQKLLTALGVYQEGYAKSKVNEKVVKSHVYEYTTTVGIEQVTNDRVHLNVNLTPVQLIFCLKEKNARKINSHRW